MVEESWCLELSWTQYSDRASLPQSFHAREELRTSLGRVKLDQLPHSDAVKVRELKRLLDEVISESEDAAASEPWRLRISRAVMRECLRPDKILLLLILVLLGWASLKFQKTQKSQAADKAAAKVADGILNTERSETESKFMLQPVASGDVFPKDVAEALCYRIAIGIQGFSKKKPAKQTKNEVTSMDTKQLSIQLALYYKPSEVEVVEKALKKERKKLRQAVQTLEKAVADTREASAHADAKVADCEDGLKTAENAKKAADAKKGPKNVRKAQDVEDAGSFLEKAKTAAAAKVKETQNALEAVAIAKQHEDRPLLLSKIEGTWLSAVTQAWSSFSAKLGGVPTTSHMHAWARNRALRSETEKLYSELANDKAFFD